MWVFEKFLIAADGQVRQRFSPRTEPEETRVVDAITALL